MKTMASIAELLNHGVKLEAHEAVAIAQQLIAALDREECPADVAPPYGPPTPANVILTADGSVYCIGCETPAVSEVAIFLDALLPAGSPGVPGALRYTIARGMLDVDVAPFDSLHEFSNALTRHEQGPRDAVVRGVLARGESAGTPSKPAVLVERRRAGASRTDLRRALREADAQLYEYEMNAATRQAPRSPSRGQMVPAVAACLGAGMLLATAGEIKRSDILAAPQLPYVAAPAMAVAEPASVTALPSERSATAQAQLVAIMPGAEARVVPRRSFERARVVARTASLRDDAVPAAGKRAPRPSPSANRAGNRRGRSGVLDHLRLGWLREAFRQRS